MKKVKKYLNIISYRPLLQSILFLLFPLSFYIVDYLNYSRAGKIALIGMSMIGTFSILSMRYSSNSILRWILIVVSFIIFINMSFHAGLRDIFGVAQDDMMIIKAIFGTDSQESFEFILQYRFYLIKHFTILILSYTLFYILALRRYYTKTEFIITKRVLIAWILFLTIAHLNTSMRISNPIVYFPHFYDRWQTDLEEIKNLNQILEKNLSSSGLSTMKYKGKSDKNTLVWVIGESSTKSNWSLYGYQRNTTPMIQSLQKELLVFDNIYAAAPITVPAFERMLTPATIKKPELWKSYPDLILMAKQAGYHVYWISNHTTDAYGVLSIFAHHADETIMTNKGKSRGEGSYDSSVLPAYQNALNDKFDKKLIIVHLLGSHPAYNFRYPDEYNQYSNIFDDLVAKELTDKGRADWAITFRNFYDNSILYGDMIRHKLLSLLKNSKESKHSTWLYHPDHGEDVCHHTDFSGHNQMVKEQWEVPMIFWPSSYTDKKYITTKAYRIDTIHNTLLGLLQIEGKYYNPHNDIFSKDFKASTIKHFSGSELTP